MKIYFWNFEWDWIQIDTCVGHPYWRPFTHHNIITFHFPHNSFFAYVSMCLASSTISWIDHISFFMYAFLFCMIFVFTVFIAVRSLVYHFQFLMHIIYKKRNFLLKNSDEFVFVANKIATHNSAQITNYKNLEIEMKNTLKNLARIVKKFLYSRLHHREFTILV